MSGVSCRRRPAGRTLRAGSRAPSRGGSGGGAGAGTYSANIYRAQIDRDAALLGVPADALTAVFPHHIEEPRRAVVAGAAPLVTRDLEISARVAPLSGDLPRGSIASDHLILRISNRTDAHLAYRVVARLPIDARGCIEKAVLPHNAIALAPRETIERTECGRAGVRQLAIERVETVELPRSPIIT